MLLTAAGDILEETVVALCQCLAAGGLHAEAQLGDELHEGIQLLGIGFVVDSVDEGAGGFAGFSGFPSLPDKLGNAAVGQQHELFDKPVGLLAFLNIDAYGFCVLVELELHLLGLEVDGSALVACRPQFLGDGMESEDGLADGRTVGHSVGFYYLLCLFVSHTAVALNHALAHPGVIDFSFVIHLHDNREAEFFLVLTEGADFVAEFLGEHGDGAVDEVDGGSALIGFAVDGAAGFHIIGNVGNMHANLYVSVR